MKRMTLAVLAFAAVAAAHAEPVTYKIDPFHTSATFEMAHFATSVNRGRTPAKEGMVTVDRAAKSGKVDVTFDVAAIDSGVPQLDEHMRGNEILKTGQFPTARFVGDKFTFNGDKVSAVSGNLTLLGQTHPVTLTAKNFNCYDSPMVKTQVCGGEFEATIKRSLWGVDYGIDWHFPDETHMLVEVEAIKQK